MKESAESSLLVAVTNYGFAESADKLKRFFSKYFRTVLIDSSSPKKPELTDVVIPNRYYSGLWNEAVHQACLGDYSWLLFCASDVSLMTPQHVVNLACEVVNRGEVGVCTPSLRPDSRTSYPQCIQGGTGKLRSCMVVEGFFFIGRVEILRKIYLVDTSRIIYGWGIDAMTAFLATRMGYHVMVDDRSIIHHPESVHPIDRKLAGKQVGRYFDDPEFLLYLKRATASAAGASVKARFQKLFRTIIRLARRKKPL